MIGELGALGALRLHPSGLAGPSTLAPSGAAKTPGTFLDALGQVGTNAVDTLKRAESVSLDGLKGEADARTVVDAVMRAEQTLQTAVAIRDKIVAAYLDISRMPI